MTRRRRIPGEFIPRQGLALGGSTPSRVEDDIEGSRRGDTLVKQQEVDFGLIPVHGKVFAWEDSDVEADSQITGQIAFEAPTSRQRDEVEMDPMRLNFAPAVLQVQTRNPGTVENIDYELGDQVWSNPGNAAASDDLRASCAPIIFTDALRARNYGFAIPSTAVILGVEVRIERRSTPAGISNDANLWLVYNGPSFIPDFGVGLGPGEGRTPGYPFSEDKADPDTNWPTVDTYRTYGGNRDLWKVALTPGIVNSTTFGIELIATGGDGASEVDHMEMTVYWAEPGARGVMLFAQGLAGRVAGKYKVNYVVG